MAHDGLGLYYCNLNRFTLVAMKASELMIGDWITMNGITLQVTRLSKYGEYQNVEPIPITPEILEKNGFMKIQDTVISTWNCSVDKMYSMSIDINRETGNISGHFHSVVNCVRLFCPVNHVHELQHASRLCGIEKEIVL